MSPELFQLAGAAVLVMLVGALFLAFYRLIVGPSLPDRVVALDLMTTLSVGIMAVYAVSTDDPVFLPVAMALALITFLATIAFARYVERRGFE